MTLARELSPRLDLAYVEDALAIASWAESLGFREDADRMRTFAQRVRSEIRPTSRWAQRSAS